MTASRSASSAWVHCPFATSIPKVSATHGVIITLFVLFTDSPKLPSCRVLETRAETGGSPNEKPMNRTKGALPETRVTFHSGDMGDTLPFKGGSACRGRSVTSWTIVSGSSPACWTARRWPPLCEEFGISRKTGYKIFDRYQGLRRPGADRPQPAAVPARQSAADGDRELDRRGSSGSIRIGARPRFASGCAAAARTLQCPAISTVHAVLDRHGLVTRRRRRRVARRGTPLSQPAQPNDLWCADYKGEFMLADRRYCYPLTVTDFASRYLLACEALSTTQGAVRLHRLRARRFRSLACPRAIRTDNGVPFASAPRALRPEQALGLVAAPGHSARAHRPGPSRAERPARAHAPDAEAGSHQAGRRQRPAAASALRRLRRALQPASGRIKRSACACPASVYAPRPRPYRGLPTLDYPFHDWTRDRHALRPDLLPAAGRSISARSSPGQRVGVRQVSDRIWLVTFMDYDLGYFDDETCRLEPIENPFGPKVLPMSPE